MDPFTNGPLHHLSQQLGKACQGSKGPSFPEVFGEVSPLGDKARDLLVELTPPQHQALADYLVDKLTDRRWAKRSTNQEVVKVILEESSIKAPDAAQHLGLAFCETLAKIDAPWMRILTHLTMAELLSRMHVYAPSCAVAYLQTFRNVDTYLRYGLTNSETTPSLFDPMHLSGGDPTKAMELVLETVLPFGEDALRLLWGLQARAARDGETVHLKVIRAEEIQLAGQLTRWMEHLGPSHRSLSHGWRVDLASALIQSERDQGRTRTGLPDTPRARAVAPFIIEVESFMRSGNLDEAARLLGPLHKALAKDPERHFTAIKDHLLHTSYLQALLDYRRAMASSTTCDTNASREQVRSLWGSAENLFNDPSSLWSRSVMVARGRAIREIPQAWRLRLPPFSL